MKIGDIATFIKRGVTPSYVDDNGIVVLNQKCIRNGKIISVMIRDLLWAELPESYDDVAIADYRQQIYEYVYNAYPAA